MIQRLLRITTILGLIALIVGLGRADVLRATTIEIGTAARPGPAERVREHGSAFSMTWSAPRGRPLYSAWIVESSRFMNVPFGSFQPDKAGLNTTVNLPVNVGIIEGPDGKLTLYDSGWQQLAYIFDWNLVLLVGHP